MEVILNSHLMVYFDEMHVVTVELRVQPRRQIKLQWEKLLG